MYLALTVKMSSNWATTRKNGIVNWYLFKADNAYHDPNIEVRLLDDPLEWIDTILKIYDHRYTGKGDILIGDTMDSRTSAIIEKYRSLAESQEMMMSDFPDEIKLQMVKELNIGHFGQQLAFRTAESLKHVEYVDSMKVNEMDTSWYIDPAEVAVNVANLLMQRNAMSQDEALVAFMKSGTFRKVLKDSSIVKLPAEDILEMYLRES